MIAFSTLEKNEEHDINFKFEYLNNKNILDEKKHYCQNLRLFSGEIKIADTSFT